jgi:hypothetical protein
MDSLQEKFDAEMHKAKLALEHHRSNAQAKRKSGSDFGTVAITAAEISKIIRLQEEKAAEEQADIVVAAGVSRPPKRSLARRTVIALKTFVPRRLASSRRRVASQQELSETALVATRFMEQPSSATDNRKSTKVSKVQPASTARFQEGSATSRRHASLAKLRIVAAKCADAHAELQVLRYENLLTNEDEQRKVRESIKKAELEFTELAAGLERLDASARDQRIMEMARLERLNPWEKAIYQENSLRLDEAPKSVSLFVATVGWLFMLVYVIFSGVYIFLFAVKRGPVIAASWLSCFLQAIGVELFVVIPLKIIIFNTVLPGNQHLSHKLKTMDFSTVSASKELCSTICKAPEMAPKAMKLLMGSAGVDSQHVGGPRQKHYTKSPLEHAYANRLLTAILVTKTVGRSYLLPSKAMFTPFGLLRYTIDCVVPVIVLSSMFKLFE